MDFAKRKPREVLDHGKEAFAQEDYETAREAYLWFWHHALDYSRSLSGVRGSYLVSNFHELAQVHERARESYEELVEANRQKLLTTPTPVAFSDLFVLLRKPGREDEMVEVIRHLVEQRWDEYDVRSPRTLELLNSHQEWALVCALYPTPSQWLQTQLSSLAAQRRECDDGEPHPNVTKEKKRRFLQDAERRLQDHVLLLFPAMLRQRGDEFEPFLATLAENHLLEPIREECIQMARELGAEDVVYALGSE